jgi:hypothetical protein
MTPGVISELTVFAVLSAASILLLLLGSRRPWGAR